MTHALALLLALLASVAQVDTDPVVSLPACITEDGPAPCVWDSATRGNGVAGPGVARFVIVLSEVTA